MLEEWKFEPDSLIFNHNGFDCKIKRLKQGHLCSYIYLNKSNSLYGKDEDSAYFSIKEKDNNFRTEITYSAFEGECWVLGFDYGHLRDLVPEIDLDPNIDEKIPSWMREFEENILSEINVVKEYKNIETAVEELKELTKLVKLFNNDLH